MPKTMKIITISLLTIIILFVSLTVQAQESENINTKEIKEHPTIYNRNVIYGTLSYGFALGSISLNYEGMIWNPQRKHLNNLWLKASIGYFAVWNIVNTQYNISLVGINGKGNKHLEYSIGTSLYYHKKSYSGILPSATIGYRYQKPKGKIIYRFGIGFPEAFYASIGVSF